MARRGRRSRSKQRSRRAGSRSSKAKSSKSRSRNTRGSGARKSTPSKRRNTRTTSRASNRRATASKARRSAPKRSAPKASKAPTKRRTPTRNRRGSGISQSRKTIGRNVGTTIKNTAKKVASTVGRVTRPRSARANTVTNTRNQTFNRQVQKIQAVNKPLGNPAVMSADGTFNRPGPGGPESEANYTSYQPGGYYGQSDTNRFNLTNLIRSGGNIFGMSNIPKSNEAIQTGIDNRSQYNVANKSRPTLTRRRSGGGSSRIAQQVAAQQMQPEIAPTIGTPAEEYDFGPAPEGDLTRIQSQAYNTQLTSSLANMFGGQGSAGYTPQGSPELSPTLQAGQSRGRRRVRMFGGRSRRGGKGDQFQRAGDRISRLTNINI